MLTKIVLGTHFLIPSFIRSLIQQIYKWSYALHPWNSNCGAFHNSAGKIMVLDSKVEAGTWLAQISPEYTDLWGVCGVERYHYHVEILCCLSISPRPTGLQTEARWICCQVGSSHSFLVLLVDLKVCLTTSSSAGIPLLGSKTEIH